MLRFNPTPRPLVDCKVGQSYKFEITLPERWTFELVYEPRFGKIFYNCMSNYGDSMNGILYTHLDAIDNLLTKLVEYILTNPAKDMLVHTLEEAHRLGIQTDYDLPQSILYYTRLKAKYFEFNEYDLELYERMLIKLIQQQIK